MAENPISSLVRDCKYCGHPGLTGKRKVCDSCNRRNATAKARRNYLSKIKDPVYAERKRVIARNSYHKNKEKRKAGAAAYRERMRAECADEFRQRSEVSRRKYRSTPEFKERQREYWRQKRANNVKVRISARMSERLRYALKICSINKPLGWERLLGYTASELHKHLTKTMPYGFSWDDFLSGNLHIDHIRPISSFRYYCVDDDQFKECWSLSNLRLLSKEDNIAKSNRLDWLI